MTVLDAYAVIQTAYPETRTNSAGRKAYGRSIIGRLRVVLPPGPKRDALIAMLGEPAKSLITHELSRLP